jgi:predicted Ser/Thr protein kinase/WD40 repeat protein
MRTIGPYEVVRELGRGGMGVVYEVRHPDIPRPLALKLILGEAHPQALARFGREAQVMARIRHPGVVTVHQLTRVAEGPILVSDLIDGKSLARLIKEALPGTLASRRAATLVRALADAVEAVHAQGVLHRDLKPDNVIVREDDSPVVLDFGIARDESAEKLTQTGQLLGTPAYMSPEQAEGGSPSRLGPATDVYSLGAILFALLAGRPPFEGATSAFEMVKKVLTEEPRWPSQDRPGVPRGLEAICRRAMARDPRSRHPSAAALRDDLDAFLAAPDVPATPGRRGAFALGGVVALLAAGGALAAMLGPGSSPSPVTSTAPVVTAGESQRPPGAPEPVTVKRWRERVDEAASGPTPQLIATLRHSTVVLAPDARKGDGLPVYARFLDDAHVVTAGRTTDQPGLVRFWDLDAPLEPTHEVVVEGGDRHLDVVALGAGRAVTAGHQSGVRLVDAATGQATPSSASQPTVRHSPALFALDDGDVLAGRFTLRANQQPTACEVIRVGPAGAPRRVLATQFPATHMDVRGDLLAVVTRRWSTGPDDPGGGELHVVRLSDGAPVLERPMRTNAWRVALSPDGRQVVVGLGGGFLVVHEVPSGEELQELQSDAVNSSARDPLLSVKTAHNAPLTGLVFSADGARLWSACGQSDLLEPWDGELRCWTRDAAGAWSWAPPLTVPPGGTFEDRQGKKDRDELLATVLSLELSPDGRVLLLGTVGGEALLYAVPKGAR